MNIAELFDSVPPNIPPAPVKQVSKVQGKEEALSAIMALRDAPEPAAESTVSQILEIERQPDDRFAYIEKVNRIYDTATGQLLPIYDFNSLTANWPKVEVMQDDGGIKKVPYGKAWLANPNRPQYKALTFDPGCKDAELLNTWRGWPVKPIKGDIGPFMEVASHVIGENNVKTFLQWCAFPLRNPGKRSLFALVLISIRHGVGKNLLVSTIGNLHGEGRKDLTPDLFTSQFNGWAAASTFAICDEFSISGNRNVMAKAKVLITEPYIMVNEKNQPAYSTKNCGSFIFTTNDPAALHIEKFDRRFFVIECKGAPLPPEVYQRFAEWRDNGGLAHLMHYLLAVDLSDYHPNGHAPSTDDKDAMADMSASDLERWLGDFCETAPKSIYTRQDLRIEFESYSGAKVSESAIGRAMKRMGLTAERRLQIKGRHPDRVRAVAVRDDSKWQAAPTAEWTEEFLRQG